MHLSKKHFPLLAACIAMLIVILDSATAFAGASQGITMCIYTVIPSLLPFFILSIYITSGMTGIRMSTFRPLMRICNVPKGGESLLFMGLLGGYPIGAQCVSNSYRSGNLEKESAERMLGFCNNAGPAFIFGMMGSMFTKSAAPWLLWLIHIISALLVGIVLPGKQSDSTVSVEKKSVNISQAIYQSVKAMANVCCWVIIFRMVIRFCSKWFLWLLPVTWQAVFTGVLELVNGCQMLRMLPSEPIRFILSSCFLALGGICIFLQTISVTGKLRTGMYLKGKLMQTYFSFVLSTLSSLMLYRDISWAHVPGVLVLIVTATIAFSVLFVSFRKKTVAFAK